MDISGGTIALDSNCKIIAPEANDDIHFFPTCKNINCHIYLGNHTNVNDQFHLTDAELDRVTTIGTLHIGDRNTTWVDHINIRGISYNWGNMGVYINAHHVLVILFFI